MTGGANFLAADRSGSSEHCSPRGRPWIQALAVVRATQAESLDELRSVVAHAVRTLDKVLDADEPRYWRLLEFVLQWLTVRRPMEQHARLFSTVIKEVRQEQREKIRAMSERMHLTYEEEAALRYEE